MIPFDSKQDCGVEDQAGTAKAQKKAPPERVKVKGWKGYVRAGTFVIEVKIGGKKFHRSTHCTTLKGAMKAYERFELDPNTFSAQGSATVDDLVFSQELLDGFAAWHRPQVGPEWAADVRRSVKAWGNHIKGADLRSLSLIDDLKPYLATKRGKPLHTQAIKLFFKWLRTERGLVTRAQDVTLDLLTPAFKARQETGESKAVPEKDLQAVVPHLQPHVRDVLELLAVTGWHISEVRRFARAGRVRARDASDPAAVIATIGTFHKGRRKHFTALLWQDHVDAAERIRARGKIITNGNLRRHMLRACEAVTVERRKLDPKAEPVLFNMGDMRASVATWLRLAGVPMPIIAEYLGHLSASTTRKYYVDSEVTATVLPRAALRLVR